MNSKEMLPKLEEMNVLQDNIHLMNRIRPFIKGLFNEACSWQWGHCQPLGSQYVSSSLSSG